MTTEGSRGLCFTEKRDHSREGWALGQRQLLQQTPPPGTAFLLPAWSFHPLRLGEEPPLGRVQAHAH